LARLLVAVDQSNTPPASELIETFEGICQEVRAAVERWNDLLKEGLAKSAPLAGPDCGQ
jgi:hypothetical protein